MKSFSSAKDIVWRMKQQATDWEKILVKHISDNRIVSKIYKEYYNLNNKKEAIQLKNGQKT